MEERRAFENGRGAKGTRKAYRPWRGQLVGAGVMIFVVPAGLVAVAAALEDGAMLATSGAALSLIVGWLMLTRVRSRQYGQRVESRYAEQAIARLESYGFEVRAGQMTHVGDVDLIVRRGRWCATVEIKSFHYWRSRWVDRQRQSRARDQALRQQSVVGAQLAVIWLPVARATWWSRLLDVLVPERKPMVVRGSPDRLARRLEAACR